MRVDSISIGAPDDPVVVQFHQRLTMVAGLDASERAELSALILAALTATGDEISDVSYVDSTGRTIAMQRDATGVHFFDDQGSEAASPMALLGLDRESLRRLMFVGPADVTSVAEQPSADEPAELQEARTTLAAVQAELSQALEQLSRADACCAEVAAIDQRLIEAKEDGAKRNYARLLAELERVRAEAESVRGGANVAEADRRFLEAADGAHRIAAHWRRAEERAEAERQRFGNRERLDPRSLAEALATPDQVPAELNELARAYEAAEARRAELAARLHRSGADSVAQPRHPAIVRLAHADQDLVWATAHHVIELAACLEGHSVALGGLGGGGVASATLADLETAHDQVDRAERVVDDRFVPGVAAMAVAVLLAVLGVVFTPFLLAAGALGAVLAGLYAVVLPRRLLTAARHGEAEALERAGVTSYLGLQYRRLEATINPAATQPLKLVAAEYGEALADWRGLGGDIEPADALALEAETRAYVASLAHLEGVADQLHRLRAELVDEAEPAVVHLRDQLMQACAPFGIDDPAAAIELAHQQATRGTLARLQHELEAAEATAAGIRANVEQELVALGFVGDDGSDLRQRLDAFDAARADARRRQQARRSARPVEQIEADLARLEALARSEHREEWGTDVMPSDVEEPDVDALRQRRQAALDEYGELNRTVPNVDRLTDRRDAMRRRVTSLVERSGGGSATTMDASAIEERLLARLAAARSAGPAGETAPLVLNEPFDQIGADQKSAVLDALERLSASVQLTYLTDDPAAVAWGRRRAAAGAISLLEPATESAVH